MSIRIFKRSFIVGIGIIFLGYILAVIHSRSFNPPVFENLTFIVLMFMGVLVILSGIANALRRWVGLEG